MRQLIPIRQDQVVGVHERLGLFAIDLLGVRGPRVVEAARHAGTVVLHFKPQVFKVVAREFLAGRLILAGAAFDDDGGEYLLGDAVLELDL